MFQMESSCLFCSFLSQAYFWFFGEPVSKADVPDAQGAVPVGIVLPKTDLQQKPTGDNFSQRQTTFQMIFLP